MKRWRWWCGAGVAVGVVLAATLVTGIVIGRSLGGGDGAESEVRSVSSYSSTPRPTASATASLPTPTMIPTVDPPGLVGASDSAQLGGSVAPPATSGGSLAEGPPPPAQGPPAAEPPPTPAPVADEQRQSVTCVACGEPRYFCDAWVGGMCNDYRQLGDTSFEVPFPPVSEPVTFDCFSSTDPGYYPTMNAQNAAEGYGTVLASPCAFSKHEHFMTRMEDGNFGMAVLRFHQPFDFAGRTGHVRFDVDLKNSARRYVRVMLSPELTKALTDDRSASDRRPGTALDVWFRDGIVDVQAVRGGGLAAEHFSSSRYRGADDVRDTVDVYVSRTAVRVDINGTTYVNASIPDLGFDRAYVYLSQVSYNPCKDGECSEREQIFHWDNVAFDGPVLGLNSLTPPGQRDLVFNTFRASACAFNGIPAAAAAADPTGAWTTFRVRVPDDGASVSPSQISCSRDVMRDGWDVIQAFEVVRAR